MLKIKVTLEEKIKAVESYLRVEVGASAITSIYSIRNQSFQEWIRKFKTFGAEGSLGISKMPTYTMETKKLSVDEYLAGKGSQADIYKKYKIHSKHALQSG